MLERNRDERPLWFDDPGDFVALRELLDRAGFTDSGVVAALGVEDVRSLSERDLAVLLRATRGGSPLETLIRLFLIGVAVEAGAARRAAEPMGVERWAEAGLVAMQGASVVGSVRLLPFRWLLLAFDLPLQPGRLRPNYVMGVGNSSLTLAALTVRRPCSLALDLGTGCGFLAFLAARHSRAVVATDRNPRAMHLAAFNARLNGLANVECLEGDLFEPVAERQFDLIVSNPPFVISPERHYVYRDSGLGGDEIVRAVLRGGAAHLRDGGYCQVLCNWARVAGEDWQERLAGWARGTGCDAWVLRSHTLDPAAYASKWIRHTECDEPEAFARRFEEWMAYYERERIESISAGLITLRRRSGHGNWFQASDSAEKAPARAGESIARAFDARDFLETMHDDSLLREQRLAVSPDARLEQRLRPSPEGWEIEGCTLRLEHGLVPPGDSDPYTAQLVARCDGTRRLGDLVGELAAALGQDPPSTEAACLGIVRRLVGSGLLLPPRDAASH